MITFFATLFALGTLGFWVLLLIDFVVITALVESENGVWATIVALGSIFGLQYLWKLPLLDAVRLNPGKTAIAVLAYFLIGACWSIAKWYFFLHKQVRRYSDVKAQFLEHENAKELTGELAVKLMAEIEKNNEYKSEEDSINAVPPLARKHKGALTRWATYWPFSMIGFALNDIVRKAWQYVYDLLQSTYQRISNYVFRGVTADAVLAEQYKAQKAAAGAGGGKAYVGTDSPRRGNR